MIERVPSLCVGSSVEAGPVVAVVVTQHATLQGAIDITLLAQVHTHNHTALTLLKVMEDAAAPVVLT
jgi:hypothetical protein